MAASYAVGVDFGANSVRALVVDVATGEEIAADVYDYRQGEAGILLDPSDPSDPNLARQSPRDYIAGFFASVSGAVRKAAGRAGYEPGRVVGIGVDTTGPANAFNEFRLVAKLPRRAHYYRVTMRGQAISKTLPSRVLHSSHFRVAPSA